MNLIIIAAIGKNNELGKDNTLIWHLKGDLKFFKEMTSGRNIVMGRRTFESLPKMLPNRHHIVITSKTIDNPDVSVYHSIEEFLNNFKSDDDIYVIGGAQIYKSLINHVNEMYLTKINAECKDADVYFPDFDEEEWTKEIIKETEEKNIEYKHVLYKRVR